MIAFMGAEGFDSFFFYQNYTNIFVLCINEAIGFDVSFFFDYEISLHLFLVIFC